MPITHPNVAICGAGMAGITAAYHLAVKHGVKNVVLIDELEPLTLTSNKGTRAYRNWWPGPGDTMVRFMNRSIDLLEEIANATDNCFQLNRRGYVFLTADPTQFSSIKQSAREISALGAGPLREHPEATSYIASPAEGFQNVPTGADLISDSNEIRRLFPFVAEDVAGMLHVRRAGWMDTNRLGMWMLEQVKSHGGHCIQDRVERVTIIKNKIQTVHLGSGKQLNPGALVIAAGPLLRQVGKMIGLEIPVVNELHGKIAFRDYLNLVPNDVPLMIWNDPLFLPWTDTERTALTARGEGRLLDEFPAGVHFRPSGDSENRTLLIIWTYSTKPGEAVFPPIFDPEYGEILLRGLSRMIPGLLVYFGQGNSGYVDGGYYCKTQENRPLIGPLPVDGAFVCGALSGYGIMGAQAAGELLAAHVVGGELPGYAPFFRFNRYEDPTYRSLLENWDATSGQL